MRLSAIDIGSNAVRLLIADVSSNEKKEITRFRKVKLYRVPVRLGMDAFTNKEISKENIRRLSKAMVAFRELMDIYEVEGYTACATSAMREADNNKDVVRAVKENSGIKINIIEGDEEADLILSNQALLAHQLDDRFSHLYVDVGGGSTEISLLNRNGVQASRSFKIGTIRLYKDMVKPSEWQKMEEWLTEEVKDRLPLNVIGSGGNINRVLKRSGNQRHEPIMIDTLRKERDLLTTLDLDDRINLQDLNRDRAEVIVPALNIFLFIMEQTGIRQVVVPKIGVADGIVRQLYLKMIR